MRKQRAVNRLLYNKGTSTAFGVEKPTLLMQRNAKAVDTPFSLKLFTINSVPGH